MAQKFLLNCVVLASAFVFADAACAETLKGVCTVSASVHGGKKYATLKCSKASEPNNYKIRSTVWEKDDRPGYGKLARFAGRRFSCDMTLAGTTRDGGMESTHYSLTKCR